MMNRRPLVLTHSVLTHMTGIIHKCDLLDICSCEFGQADRQRNKPEYGCLESHISPTACLHQMWGCADIHLMVEQNSKTEIQRSGWKRNDKIFKPLREKVYAVHRNKNFAFLRTCVSFLSNLLATYVLCFFIFQNSMQS